jgi:exodeoxyribonuclease-3
MYRLLTYNIKRGGRGRVDAIANVINACTPDIVLLQEATDPVVVTRLAGLCGMADCRAAAGQSLAYLSRVPVASCKWVRPRLSRHAFIEVVPAGAAVRLFGVHLSAVHAAWTERRRLIELGALLRSVQRHEAGFHLLAGDFNTLAPGERLDLEALPLRLRPFVWLSGGRIRWRTIQTVIDNGYVDVFRMHRPNDPGLTMPATHPHVRLDYVFAPSRDAGRITRCDVVRHPATLMASDHLPVIADVTL